jgi:hypothetical protein
MPSDREYQRVQQQQLTDETEDVLPSFVEQNQ